MVVTVTGGGGRLGNVLVRALLERKHTVRVLEPGDGPIPSLAGLPVELVRGSVLDTRAVEEAVDSAKVVYHVAAKVHLAKDRDGSLYAVNVRGTEVVLKAAKRVGARLVHCSSHHALHREPFDVPLDENRPLALREPCDYHRSKALAEELVLREVAKGDLDAVIVNPGTMVGPYDFEPSIMGRALLKLARRELPAMIDALTDYVDARDVADGMIAAAEKGRRGERYLLTAEVLTARAMLNAWCAVAEVPAPRFNLPVWSAWPLVPVAALAARFSGKPPELTAGVLRAAVGNRVVRNDKARKELGYAPRPLSIAFRDTYAFFVEQGLLPPVSQPKSAPFASGA